MRNRWLDLLLLPALLAVVLLARTLPARYGTAMPQVPGDDLLQLVLGDARRQLGQQMLAQADNYYHGGVTHADCTGLQGHEHHDHAHDHHHAHGHDHHHDADHHHTSHDHGTGTEASFTMRHDPWRWISSHVHAQHHRHIAEEQFGELLPWLWAACRAAPDDIQARLTAAYVIERVSGEAHTAIRLLEEGLEVVPDSPELAFSLGEMNLIRLKDEATAEQWFGQSLTNSAPRAAQGDEDARLLTIRSLHYLAVLAHRRNDTARLQELVRQAEAEYPTHKLTQAMRRMLRPEGGGSGSRQ